MKFIKELFYKELAIFSSIKQIRLKDVNLGGAFIALIIMVVYLITKNSIFILGLTHILYLILALLIIALVSKPHVDKRELNVFLCIEVILLFLHTLLLAFIPNSVFFLKIFISMYALFNLFVFVLYSTCHYLKTDLEYVKKEKKELPPKAKKEAE